MIIALACYSNEDMPEVLAQYSYISNLREEMMELFCCSGISTLNTKFNTSFSTSGITCILHPESENANVRVIISKINLLIAVLF